MRANPFSALPCRPWRQARRNIAWLLVLLLPAFSYFPAFAQQTEPTTYAGFEGQAVSSVEIAVRSEVDIRAIRHLIQQQAGTPFSQEAIQTSVAALQNTHLFSQVQVRVEPEQTGVRILFILQPTDYVGAIEFPGTGTKFPYTSLLQAADIPDQSPYFEELRARGQAGLVAYFGKQGYFDARVEQEIQRDEAHRIVNMIFRCSLGKQAKIRNIEFVGLSEQQNANLLVALRGPWARLKRASLKPGQRYSEPRVQKSVDFVRAHLQTQSQLAPLVHLAPPRYDSAAKRVDVTFNVTPGPKVSVRLAGANVSNRTLRRLVPIYEEGSVDEDLIDEGRRNLASYFQTKGYFDVTAASHVDRRDDTINVVYEISRGSKHHVEGVYFAGNETFSAKQLRSHVFVKKGLLFSHGTYSQQLLTKSVNSLKEFYKDAGFGNVSIEPKIEDFEPQVDVTFRIAEGPQDQVGAVGLVGNKTQSAAALDRKQALGLHPGSPFSQKLLDTDRNRLLAAYLDLGYPNATVRSSVSPAPDNPHKMNVTFTIEEGTAARIREVVILGEKHTKPEFVEQVVGSDVKAQQSLSEGRFLQAESNLYDLGIFDSASVRPLQPVVDQNQEEVVIKLHESPLNSVDVGGGLEVIPRDGNVPVNSVVVPGIPPISLGNKFTVSQKSFIGPRFTFDFSRHDLRGRAETATIGTVLSRLDQRIFFTYADPHLHGSSWSSLLSFSAERTTLNPIYTAELGQLSLQTQKALDKKRTKNVIVRYSFQRTNLYNIVIPSLVLPTDQHVRLSTFEGEYIHDTRDKPLDAHHGVYQTADFGITARAVGASANFVRFLGQSAFYVPVRPWLVWATNFRLGLAKPFAGSDVPLSERFFTGGADSLRGFPINGAGPQRPVTVCSNPSNTSTCTLISVPSGGNMLFIVNSEARLPLPIKSGLGAVLFYDGGNVYNNINFRQFTNDFTHSVGVGIRYQTPVGPVRFDVGYRITSVPGVKATQYFVTLGQSF